ncbi:hypothetical protein DXA25_07345 [Ruminococcus bromii]|nr:hypothetical protein DXA25_07345 [Ruminococcus bromii]
MFPFRNAFLKFKLCVPISARFYFNIFQFVIFLAKQSYYSKNPILNHKIKKPFEKRFLKGLDKLEFILQSFFL